MKLFLFFFFFIPSSFFSQNIKDITSTIVERDGKFGLVEDGSGKTVLTIDYDTIINLTLFKGFYSYKKNGKYGYARLIRNVELKENYRLYDSSYWEISENEYDEVLLDSQWADVVILKKGNVNYFQIHDMYFIHDLDQNPHHIIEKRAFIEGVYNSKIEYDSIYIDQNIIFLQSNNKWGLCLQEFKKELPCQWDSVTPLKRNEKYISFLYVWKNSKMALLKTNWNINDPGVAESRNYILTTPYEFNSTNELIINNSSYFDNKVFVNQINKSIRFFDMETLKETIIQSEKGPLLRIDTTKEYNIYFIGKRESEKSIKNQNFILTSVNSKNWNHLTYDYKLKSLKSNIITGPFSSQLYFNKYDVNGSTISSYSETDFMYKTLNIKNDYDIVLGYNLSSTDSNNVSVTLYSSFDKTIIKQYSKKNKFIDVEDGVIYSIDVTDINQHLKNGRSIQFGRYSDESPWEYRKLRLKTKVIGYIKYDPIESKYRVVRFKWMAG